MLIFRTSFLLLCASFAHSQEQHEYENGYSKCTDSQGRPQRCETSFGNAAFGKHIEVTNTCGEEGRTEYCIQSGALGVRRACDVCDARDPRLYHPPRYLTDFHNTESDTWWQSETMYEGVQYPNRVNLTLHLGKAFHIVNVHIRFHSLRPESLAIYRKVSEESEEWLPFQYFSSTCRDFYGQPDSREIHGGEEARALCTSEYSDLSPLSGGDVSFATLEGRPSRHEFYNSKELQDWVTATDIRVSLDRLNTFGDEVFGDEKVLRSYFYAISDFTVGAKCKYNGHASECVPSSSQDGKERLVCKCEHNTAGPDCNECLPFYNDRPWAIANATDAHECKPCNCNDFSGRCIFDQKLYETTGHGGHCIDCIGNRDGPNCQRCKLNYYQPANARYCIACNCNEIGSRSMQCNSEGKCQCKPGVAGEKCDRCQANYYNFSPQGCKPCSCTVPGSFANEPSCDTITGACRCKENVEGQQCQNCKPGYFNLDLTNDFGCTLCFCFAHAAVCRSAPGFHQVLLESLFQRGNERWDAQEANSRAVPIQYNAAIQAVTVTAQGREPVYFLAPDRFLGDQRGSYNQELNFTFRIGEHGSKPSAEDIILEGAGLRVSRPIFGYRNTLPSVKSQEFSFRFHEHQDFGWNPRLTARDFMSILSNLTAIKIRATYSPRGVGFLESVTLKTARRGAAGNPAPWIEMCTCPDGYIGQFCESCAASFTREPKNGGPFARCVPCYCYNHADIRDPESGQCICQHNTAGQNCERCARGYYGNSLKGTVDDCSPCPCPNQGACIQLQDETIVCLECPVGYAGPQCEFCSDGYYGDPSGQNGFATECRPCECNENIDPNAVGNCNRTTGECLKCIYNTGESNCQKCLPGFFGDALALPKGDCKHCECNRLGTTPTADGSLVCEQLNLGQCPCRPNVIGRQCDTCEEGFFDLASVEGCKECGCDYIGSLNSSCDVRSGQCNCREGVVGLRCNDCAPNHYGFSLDGCKPCQCDPIGATSLQCDPSGQCPCRENVEGRACERCKENKFDRQAGCMDYPACYQLVQEAVNEHRIKLDEMENQLIEIANTPTVVGADFEKKLTQVQERVARLWTDALSATGGEGGSLLEQISEMKDRLSNLQQISESVRNSMNQCSKNALESSTNLTIAEATAERAQEALKNAQRFLDSDGKEALERAQEKSSEYGQQSNLLSEMARRARNLAEEHEERASEIEKIGAVALNTSTEAYELAKNSLGQHRNATDESRTLLQTTQQLQDEVKSTEQKANEALRKSKEAYNNALNAFKDANSLSLPTVDTIAIKRQAQEAKTRGENMKESVVNLIKENEELMKEAQGESEQARHLLAQVVGHQQQADELLADLDKTKAVANEARNQSESTFKEATEIYNTLQDFHSRVENSKTSAAEAKTRIPEIETLIREAEVQRRANLQALAGSKETASKALKDANQAKEISETASQEAEGIRSECGDTKDEAGKLRDEALELNTRVADTLTRLTQSENKVNNEDTEVKQALEKASEARSQAQEAYEKVEKALGTVRDINNIALNSLDHINEDGLGNLERKIGEVERELQSAGLDEKIEALRTARNKQTLWIKNYEDELEMLRREVANLEEIKNALPPDGHCWKRSINEP